MRLAWIVPMVVLTACGETPPVTSSATTGASPTSSPSANPSPNPNPNPNADPDPKPDPPKPDPPKPDPPKPVPAWETLAATTGTHWPLPERSTAIHAGVDVLSKHQCTRCHEIDGIAGAGRPYDCVSCHTFLKSLEPGQRQYEQIAAKNGRNVLERYLRNIEHLRRVPSLTNVARRLRLPWIASFLAAPFDVRPALEESMIRNRLTKAEIETIVRYFAAIADVPPTAATATPTPKITKERVAEGKKTFIEAGCPSCHTAGDLRFSPHVDVAFLDKMWPAAALAPNLRFARDRVRPEVLVDWILDPSSVQPDTAMPTPPIRREDAEAIRDFLLGETFDLRDPLPVPLVAAMPPPVAYDVSWEMVKERVLGKVCVHCHMNEHEKDTGPGNGGGFGYPGKGLSFRTYEMAMRGSRLPDGKRYSVFQPYGKERWPRVLEAMLVRRIENRRDLLGPFEDRDRPAYPDATKGQLGMPLGLPAMTDEEMGILRRWIDQGCPGPRRVSGRDGFTDGFLVPDGPIEKNHGCEVREPSEPPPPWATARAGTAAKPDAPPR